MEVSVRKTLGEINGPAYVTLRWIGAVVNDLT
jgi:hypothetical protein